jgi:hypothetical protein
VPNWYLGYFVYIKTVDWEKQREGFPKIEYSERTQFLYNHKDGQVFRIGESFVNDYLGTTDRFDLNIQSNGIAFAKYEALDLVEYADSATQSSETDPEMKKRLKEILDSIDEEGNPCLLVGALKRGI